MTVIYVVLGLAAAFFLWAVNICNRLIRNRNMVEEGWSGIDVQLKRRANLIPNLIETVKGYMGHERGVLEDVTKLRVQSMEAGAPGEKGKAAGSRALR
ncbi:MAG: LemA family protein [Rhodospirillales bacterium]